MKRLGRRILLWIPVVVVLTYLAVLANVYVLQDSLVFHPTKEIVATPANWGMAFSNEQFWASDGTQLNGWFLPGNPGKPVVLFCHGNTGNISGREPMLSIFSELGVGVFIFDYRGYGKSEGKPFEEGTYQDAMAAWSFLSEIKKIPADNILLFGRSLGAGVVTHLAAKLRIKPKGVVLMSPFTTLPDAGQSVYPFLPIRWLSKYHYPNVKNIKKIDIPLLIFHSKGDEMVPYSQGRALYRAANSPKKFVDVQGGHNDAVILSRTEILRGLRNFFSTL